MKLKIIIVLIVGFILSGCITKTPTKSELENTQLVDNYCKSKGYEYGSTEYVRHSERWNYVMTDDGRPTYKIIEDNDILCIRNTKEIDMFWGSDFKAYADTIIFVEKQK